MSDSEYNNRKKLEQLEAEIYNSTSVKPEAFTSFVKSVKNWFATLPSAGKVVVGVFGLMIAFSVLRTVLSIVQLTFSLVILGVIFYIVFQFVSKPKP
jgi:ABC-type phosphate transport system permease subunit